MNRKHFLCQECNYIRLNGHKRGKTPIKYKRSNDKFHFCTKWGFSSEKDLFEHLWKERPHVSGVSGKPIAEAMSYTFAHILAKGINKYPHLRFCPWNICFMTLKEHHLWDNGSVEQQMQYADQIKNMQCWDELHNHAYNLKKYYKTKFWEDERHNENA